jgi:integrase/recombinase XerD
MGTPLRVVRQPSRRQASIDSFRRQLQFDDKSRETIKAYTGALASLDAWLATRERLAGRPAADFSEVSSEELKEFFKDWRLGDELHGINAHAFNTVHQKYRSLKTFYNWLGRDVMGDDWINPIKKVELRKKNDKDRKLPASKVLTDEQIAAILALVARKRDFYSLRDHAILRVFLEGARRSEVAFIELADLDLERRLIRLVGAKGDASGERERIIKVSPATIMAVDKYLTRRQRHKAAGEQRLWLGKAGKMTEWGVADVLYRRAEQAGVKLHPHMFRHTFSHNWLKAGGSEDGLMTHQGWVTRAMIQVYGSELAEERAHLEADRLGINNKF